MDQSFLPQRESGVRINRAWTCLLLLFVILSLRSTVLATERQPALESTLHTRTIERAAKIPRLRSLLVSVDGKIVSEQYFRGAHRSYWANLKSASKSVLSILIGIAIDKGNLKGVKETIHPFFPEHFRGIPEPEKKQITIEDLLTMRSGMETTSRRNYGRWVHSPNWVRHVLTRPMVDVPGGRMVYSTGNTHLLSAILTKATGLSTFQFARRNLADPLGIPIRPWIRDPQGIYLGGNEMHLTPRAMLKIGELYLNRGQAGGKQIVSEAWVRESLKPRTRSRFSDREYGYGWWMSPIAEYQAYYAYGHGGQFIFIIPDLKLTAVMTSATEPRQERRERRMHRWAVQDLLENDLIPAAVKERNRISRPR